MKWMFATDSDSMWNKWDYVARAWLNVFATSSFQAEDLTFAQCGVLHWHHWRFVVLQNIFLTWIESFNFQAHANDNFQPFDCDFYGVVRKRPNKLTFLHWYGFHVNSCCIVRAQFDTVKWLSNDNGFECCFVRLGYMDLSRYKENGSCGYVVMKKNVWSEVGQ